MNWEALGAVGETIGAVAVLVTLVYLAVQVRQNTAQQKREELVSIQHGQNAIVSQLMAPQVMSAYVRTAEDRSPTIEDRGTCLCFVVQYLNHFQIVHDMYLKGSLEEEQYQLWAGFAVAFVAPEGVRRWWDAENGRLAFHSEVRALIDARLQDSESTVTPITKLWSQFNGDAWARTESEP